MIMGMEFYNTRNPIARKPHKCEMCGREIKPGERHSQEVGKWNGDFFERRLHLDCEAVLVEYCSEVDNEFTYDEIADYWRDTHCDRCKHYYLLCQPDEMCKGPAEGCTEKNAFTGRCMAGDRCYEMTRVCWCDKFDPFIGGKGENDG